MGRSGFGALLLLLSAPVAANEAAPWRAVDAETGQIRDLDGLRELAEAFPNSGSVRLRMLQPLLEAGEIDQLLEVLSWLQIRGYVFGDVSREQIPALVGEEHAEAAKALLIPKIEPVERSKVIATVPAEAGLIESVFAVESEDVVLVATSITQNAAFARSGGDEWERLDIANANDLSGIVSAHDGSVGYVASSNLDGSIDELERFTGIIGLTGDLDESLYVPAPEGVSVSDLSIGPNGTVYASDPLGGGVYSLDAGSNVIGAVIEPGTFRSPQGSAVSEDGERLYVSDYRYGLALVELNTGEVFRVESDMPLILDGIDGLWLHNGKLIAVQNGTSPMRISAFTISEDGTRITNAQVLEQAHGDWTEPLGGSISGDALFYVGTGQWDRYVSGQPAQDKPGIPTQIRRLPLTFDPG